MALSSKMYSFVKSPYMYGKPITERVMGIEGNSKEGVILRDGEEYDEKMLHVHENGRENYVRKAKGINKAVTEKDIRHETYCNSLFNGTQFSNKQRNIRSKKHNIGVYECSKTSINPFNTKRYILDDGVNTLAFGHYKSREIDQEMKDDFYAELVSIWN